MTQKIVFSKFLTCTSLFFAVITQIHSQEYAYKVTAKSGDGIFSLLRNEGIDVVKYYEEFINLNEESIKNGSHLVVGTAYKIPFAPDSFKNSGVRISMQNGKEEPIFKNELASLKRKDSSLQNAVYYLISDNKDPGGIIERMARKLLESKAKVYVFDYVSTDSNGLMNTTSIINKKYLKHNGKYQRVLVLNSEGFENGSKTQISLYHNANSVEGKQMAEKLLMTFGDNKIKEKSFDEYVGVFSDFKRVAFAKNLLPPIAIVELGDKGTEEVKSISVTSDKKKIADMIAGGILIDYSRTEFENE